MAHVLRLTRDDFQRIYGDLCDFFWRLDWPDTPEDDGLQHTSSVCRARASRVVEILGLKDFHSTVARKHFESLAPEAKLAFAKAKKQDQDDMKEYEQSAVAEKHRKIRRNSKN